MEPRVFRSLSLELDLVSFNLSVYVYFGARLMFTSFRRRCTLFKDRILQIILPSEQRATNAITTHSSRVLLVPGEGTQRQSERERHCQRQRQRQRRPRADCHCTLAHHVNVEVVGCVPSRTCEKRDQRSDRESANCERARTHTYRK